MPRSRSSCEARPGRGWCAKQARGARGCLLRRGFERSIIVTYLSDTISISDQNIRTVRQDVASFRGSPCEPSKASLNAYRDGADVAVDHASAASVRPASLGLPVSRKDVPFDGGGGVHAVPLLLERAANILAICCVAINEGDSRYLLLFMM